MQSDVREIRSLAVHAQPFDFTFDLATSAIAPGEVRSLRAMPSPSAAKPWRALGGAGQTRQPAEVPPCQRGPAGLPRLAAARDNTGRLTRPRHTQGLWRG